MTRSWIITEKTISVLQIIWGGLMLSLTIWSAKLLIDFGVEHLELTWENISLPKILKNYHFRLLLSLLTIFGGLTLMINKRIGWILSVVTSLLYGITTILAFQKVKMDTSFKLDIYDLLAGLIAILFFTIFGLLLTRQFRNKYKPTNKTWWIIVGLVILLLVDRLLIDGF